MNPAVFLCFLFGSLIVPAIPSITHLQSQLTSLNKFSLFSIIIENIGTFVKQKHKL